MIHILHKKWAESVSDCIPVVSCNASPFFNITLQDVCVFLLLEKIGHGSDGRDIFIHSFFLGSTDRIFWR